MIDSDIKWGLTIKSFEINRQGPKLNSKMNREPMKTGYNRLMCWCFYYQSTSLQVHFEPSAGEFMNPGEAKRNIVKEPRCPSACHSTGRLRRHRQTSGPPCTAAVQELLLVFEERLSRGLHTWSQPTPLWRSKITRRNTSVPLSKPQNSVSPLRVST